MAGGADAKVYTYTGNVLGTVVNPSGGDQFLGNKADWVNYTTGYARAQHDFTFGSGKYTMTYDFNVNWLTAPPSVDNIGSFSLQPSATANYFQSLFHWTDFNNPTTFIFDYGVDTTGLGVSGGIVTFYSAGPDWTGLLVNHWYRTSATWDYATNMVTEVTLQDLTIGGQVFKFNPTNWYLSGGANNVLAQPAATAFRFFGGGATDGNLACYDNLTVGPSTSTETLAPTAFSVGTSKLQSGTLASLAADDNDPLVVCKFLVPNFNDIIKVSFDFQTTKANITAIDLVTKAKMVQGGVFKVRPFLHNYSTNVDDVIAADTAITAIYNVFTFPASGTLNNYKDATKKMNAKILVRQLGPSVAVIPCVSYEYVNLKVTG